MNEYIMHYLIINIRDLYTVVSYFLYECVGGSIDNIYFIPVDQYNSN
jgi:hypothetical protein